MSSLQSRTGAKNHLEQWLQRSRSLPRPVARRSQLPLITVLLCTFNGARFLAAQLASIEQQTHTNWRLIVSDDGSTDDTLAIVQHFADRVSQPVEVRSGPRRGPAANFLSLATDPTLEGDLFAFCDQDDVWHASKLSRALAWIKSQATEVPAVYGARTRIVCADGKASGYSPVFRLPPTFANALAQSIAGANTMVFNRTMKELLEKTGITDIVSHDWWAYQLATGSGGNFHYDSEPQVDYRQHCGNCIGTNRGLRAQWHRLRMLFDGRFARWNDVNLDALQRCRHLLTEEAVGLVDTYVAMRGPSLSRRLKAFATSGIRRQSVVGNVALLGAVILRKL